MALYEINGRVKQKRDTAANWEAKNPVILNGEIVFVDTSAGELRAKIGDGVKKYSYSKKSDVPSSFFENDVITLDEGYCLWIKPVVLESEDESDEKI